MSIRSEIDVLIAESDGDPVTAEHVVDQARDAARFPALNEHLWRVSEATLAREARLARAHKLLIRIHVTSSEGTVTRLLMHTRDTKGYRRADLIAATPDLASIKLKQLAADIGRARERLRAFRSILPDDVADDIDAALRQAVERATPPLTRQAV